LWEELVEHKRKEHKEMESVSRAASWG